MSGAKNRRNRKRSTDLDRQPSTTAKADNRHVRGASDGQRAVIEYIEGPLPSPDALAKYEAICPGAANRIIAMAEQQASHRQGLEGAVVPAAIQAEKIGQRNGLIVALAGLAASITLGLAGEGTAAGIVGGGTVVGLASVFVIGRFAQSRERAAAD